MKGWLRRNWLNVLILVAVGFYVYGCVDSRMQQYEAQQLKEKYLRLIEQTLEEER